MRRVRFVHFEGRLSPLGRFFVFLSVLAMLGVFTVAAVVAFGLLIVFAPVVAGIGLALYLLQKVLGQRPRREPPAADGIIEGAYRVVDPDAPKLSRRSRDWGSEE